MNNIIVEKSNNCGLLRQIDFQPIEFLNYWESIKQIRGIIKDSNILTLLLKAQAKVLDHLNDIYLNCPIPWDKRTSLPSHPSMIADAQKYTNFFQCSTGLKSVLDSFFGWSLFAEEELLCCCGGSLLKPRLISLDVMLNHALRVDRIDADYFLIIKQLVGVRCGDNRHLKNHYNFGKMSQMMDDLSMIFIAEVGFNLKSDQVGYKVVSSQKADQFNFEEFSRRINAVTGEI